MDILAISPFPPQKDGGSTSVYEFFKRMSIQGFNIKVISYLSSNKVSDNLESVGLNLGKRMSLKRGIKFITKTIRVGRKLNKKFKFDAIYSKNITSPSFAAYYLSLLIKKPLVVHTSGADIQELDTKNQRYKSTKGFLFTFTKFLRKRVLKRAKAIIANNSVDYQILIDLGFEKKTFLIRNGVDKVRFSSPKKEKKEELLEIIFVGRPEQEKNPDHVLKIANSVKNHFDILGGSEEEFSKFGDISSNISIVGVTDEIEEYYKKSDIFIQTSSSEGLSNALLEAMSCRNVPITYPSGDAIILIKDGINGFLVNTIGEAIEKIEYLNKNQDQYLQMSEKAHQKIHDEFDWEESVKKMITVFTKLT